MRFTRSLVPRSKLSWNERYAELVEFRRLNGHCQVPQRYPLNPALGKWVHNQRQALRKQKSIYAKARIEALLAINFHFSALPKGI